MSFLIFSLVFLSFSSTLLVEVGRVVRESLDLRAVAADRDRLGVALRDRVGVLELFEEREEALANALGREGEREIGSGRTRVDAEISAIDGRPPKNPYLNSTKIHSPLVNKSIISGLI